MDAATANLVLDATAKTIVNILWGEVQGGEWDTTVERMENAMHAARAIIQHANVILGIVIAVKQRLHPQDMQWPHWMHGCIVCTQYESGSATTDQNEFSQQLEEVLGMEEEETWGEEILQMKMEEDKEDKHNDCANARSHIYPHSPSTPTPSSTPVPVSAPQRHGCPKSGPRPPLSGQHANACSTCINFGVLCMPVAGFSCDTCRIHKKKCKQAGKRRGRSASCANPSTLPGQSRVHSRGQSLLGGTGPKRGWSTSCAQQPTEAGTSHVRSRGQSPFGGIQVESPTESPAPLELPRKILCWSSHTFSSTRGMSAQATPSAKTQDPPNMESSTIAVDKPIQSSSQGLKLHIPPAQSHTGTASNMEADTSNIPSALHSTYCHTAPPASAPKAPHNMGLIPRATYTLSRNPLVSHLEHHAAMQWMEAMEVENHKLHGLVTQALACIKVLEQGMASLGRI
ncbi:hypothetical protein BS17DRAFT_765099 [Gyrodon lividus]|nr:hypothetical protein BS17DRAFT_765099 [Gyrodon lividus]